MYSSGMLKLDTMAHESQLVLKKPTALIQARTNSIMACQYWLILIVNKMFVARRGASLADERVGAERRRKSEAQPNREGVAAGSATPEKLNVTQKRI